MAREATITQEQVNQAAEAIRAAGVKPTARGVREALGAGSMATVLKLLQVWQSGQVQQAQAQATLPPAIQRALVEFISEEVASSTRSLEAELVSVRQANGDLIAESERQAASLESQDVEIDELRVSLAEVQGRLIQLMTDLKTSHAETDSHRQTAEATRIELAKSQLRLEDVPKLEAEVLQLRSTLEAERRGRTQAEQAAAVAEARLDKTESQVKDLERRLTRAEEATRI